MKRFGLTIAVVHMLVSGGARALETTVISGSCLIVQMASKSTTCATPATVVYMSLPNGVIVFNVPLSDNSVPAFVGDRDSQPKPEEYVLYLKRVRIAHGSEQETPVSVTGTCKMNVSTDGTIVHRIICDATDNQGRKFLLDFRGDGQPVQTRHF
jgi:hypothetical protein